MRRRREKGRTASLRRLMASRLFRKAPDIALVALKQQGS